jgi:hypothetical protein
MICVLLLKQYQSNSMDKKDIGFFTQEVTLAHTKTMQVAGEKERKEDHLCRWLAGLLVACGGSEIGMSVRPLQGQQSHRVLQKAALIR